MLARVTSATALTRLDRGEDVAAARIYLVGESGRNITGQNIMVDIGTIA